MRRPHNIRKLAQGGRSLIWFGGACPSNPKRAAQAKILGFFLGSISKPMCDIKMGPQIGAIFINNSFNKGFLTFSKKSRVPKNQYLGGKNSIN